MSWLTKDTNIQKLNNYDPFIFNSKTNKTSGIVCYVKKSLNGDVKDISIQNLTDIGVIRIRLKNKKFMSVLGLYRYNRVRSIISKTLLKTLFKLKLPAVHNYCWRFQLKLFN